MLDGMERMMEKEERMRKKWNNELMITIDVDKFTVKIKR